MVKRVGEGENRRRHFSSFRAYSIPTKNTFVIITAVVIVPERGERVLCGEIKRLDTQQSDHEQVRGTGVGNIGGVLGVGGVADWKKVPEGGNLRFLV